GRPLPEMAHPAVAIFRVGLHPGRQLSPETVDRVGRAAEGPTPRPDLVDCDDIRTGPREFESGASGCVRSVEPFRDSVRRDYCRWRRWSVVRIWRPRPRPDGAPSPTSDYSESYLHRYCPGIRRGE